MALPHLVATHLTSGGGDPMVGIVFVGILASAAWVLFSPLAWRWTVLSTVGGWALLLGGTLLW